MADKDPVYDFRSGQIIPGWVRDCIDTHLAIEAEDAKSAGALGFMSRALVIATMPYKDPKADVFTRSNGDFRLRIVAGYEGGIPFGIYPRLLMSWVTTEAVRTGSPVIFLGDSLRDFLRDVIGVRSRSGGARSASARVNEQMKRLFGSLITAQYSGDSNKRGFLLKNILIAEELASGPDDDVLWTPQSTHEAGKWQSYVRLSAGFHQECINKPVPIDLRAYKGLRDSPLAMDLYSWLTYRYSYTTRRTKLIRWEPLMMQFGSGYSVTDPGQAQRDFKKAVKSALTRVQIVYPQARYQVEDGGLILLPSPPHILPAYPPPAAPKQGDLF